MKAPPSPNLFQHLNTSWACGCIRLRFISSTVPKQTADKERHTSHSIGLKPLQQQRLTGAGGGGCYKLEPHVLCTVPLLRPPKAKNRPVMLCFFQKKAEWIYRSSNKSKLRSWAQTSALHCTEIVFHTQQELLCLLSDWTVNVAECMAVGSNIRSLKRDLFCSNDVSKRPSTSGSGS